jgi:hypothetical protein
MRQTALAREHEPTLDGSRQAPAPTPPVLRLASAIGNQAFSRLVARATPAVAEPALGPVAPQLDCNKLAVDLMETAMWDGDAERTFRLNGERALHDYWARLEADLLGAKKWTMFTPLRTPERAAVLAEMNAEQRRAAADELFDVLVSWVTMGALTGERVAEELEQIGPTATKAILAGRGGWPDIRPRLLEKFVSLEAIRSYYEDEIVMARFFGHKVQVHREMQAALVRAEAKYSELGGDPAKVGITDIGGLSIRPNTNSLNSLSDHSYGSAVDINAAENPNVQLKRFKGEPARAPEGDKPGTPGKLGIPDFWDFVAEVVGEDVYQRELDKRGRSRKVENSAEGPSEVGVAEAERLAAISDKLVAMFASQGALVEGMEAYVEGHVVTVPAGGAIWLLSQATAAATVHEDQRDEQMGRIAAKIVEWSNLPGAGGNAPVGPIDPADAEHMALRLAQMALAFIESGGPGSGVKKPEADAKPTIGSIVAHGFMNLDPLLVGALTGTDGGGGLTWLGATSGTRDSMHFELPEPPIPARPAPGPPIVG